LFGLYDYKFEVLGLLYHALHLTQNYGVGPRTICIPRVRPALGSALQKLPHPVSDQDFKKLIAVMKLALPYTGICLSTRELPALREELFSAGIVQLSAGSRTNPGGYAGEECRDEEQFTIEDGRSVEEMSIVIGEAGFLPSFCTDCFTSKRDGGTWLACAQQGTMSDICSAQAVKSLRQFREKCAPEQLPRLNAIINKYRVNQTRWGDDWVIALKINGEVHSLPEGTTVTGMLLQWNLVPERVVIEHNGIILKRGNYADVVLRADDVVEIIQFVGGGWKERGAGSRE
jgi:thiamine biosynthesis protein ThiS